MEQPGKDFVILIGDGITPTEGFVRVGGLRSTGLSNTESMVDVSDKDRPTRQVKKARLGNKDRSISGSGVAKSGDAGLEQARLNYEAANTIRNWQIVWPGYGTYQGPFAINQLDITGEDADVVMFDIALEATGDITFTSV